MGLSKTVLNVLMGLALSMTSHAVNVPTPATNVSAPAAAAITMASLAAEFKPFVEQEINGDLAGAFESLKKKSDSDFSKSTLHLKYLLLGKWAVDLGRFDEAAKFLSDSRGLNSIEAAHIRYLQGLAQFGLGNFVQAKKHLDESLRLGAPTNIGFEASMLLARIAKTDKSPRNELFYLNKLERRWRRTDEYPRIVWQLIGAESRARNRHRACKWSRKIYSRYPSFSEARSWTVDAEANVYDGQKLGCGVSRSDIKDRLRHLQLSGEITKARLEIETLRQESGRTNRFETDLLLVSFFEYQGFPEEALQILKPYKDSHGYSFPFLMALAKSSSRLGEFAAAIGAYEKAYRQSPGSKAGRSALFTAGLLSYQIQDYDGAVRRFQNVVKKYPGSGLARDAKWHLAWLNYLRGDYPAAEKSFQNLMSEKVWKRRRRYTQPYADERTKYWFAMSQLRQGKLKSAVPMLAQIARNKDLSYYSLLAGQRLSEVPEHIRSLVAEQTILATSDEKTVTDAPAAEVAVVANASASQEEEKTMLAQLMSDNKDLAQWIDAEGGNDVTAVDEAVESAQSEEDESEETLAQGLESDGSENSASEVAASDDSENDKDTDGVAEKTFLDGFRDSKKLREKFLRAHEWAALGLNDWAKSELLDIERRTSGRQHLRDLVQSYLDVGAYHRVAYISEIFMRTDRLVAGVKPNSQPWLYNFPRAYENFVQKHARKTGVKEELVWAIMRAESQYNKDVISPVGARGLLQIMPYTAQHLTRLANDGKGLLPDSSEVLGKLLDPETNITLGTMYLKRLSTQFEGVLPLVAAAYNAGPHRVTSWLSNFGTLSMDEFIEHVPFAETRNYMKKVSRNFVIYNRLYNGKTTLTQDLIRTINVKIPERPSPRETWEKYE
jgi:soluble lytic murein transglycosylase